jgi:predicted GIY-YIG superfamily endonuclease
LPAERKTRPSDSVAHHPVVDGEAKEGKTPGSVYILESEDAKLTYVGWTVDLGHRLRQHNGELVGGAKYTKRRGGGWRFAGTVTGVGAWWTRTAALQFEWALKRQRRKSGRNRHGGPVGPSGLCFPGHPAISHRLVDLHRLLHTRKQWTRTSPLYTDAEAQSVRIELVDEFCTTSARQRFAAAAFWNPHVAPLQPQ